jgi:hypothetical protein
VDEETIGCSDFAKTGYQSKKGKGNTIAAAGAAPPFFGTGIFERSLCGFSSFTGG